MIESYALLYINNPKELIFGRIEKIDDAGIIIRGIPVIQIETFKYQFKKEEQSVFFQTMFYPMHRVERIVKDEHQGRLSSTLEEILAASKLSETELRHL